MTLTMLAADALVLLGLIALTLAVAAVVRLPDVFAKIHAAAFGLTAGALPVLAAVLVGSPGELKARALLVGVFLMATAPVGAHALARLARRESSGPGAEAGEAARDTGSR